MRIGGMCSYDGNNVFRIMTKEETLRNVPDRGERMLSLGIKHFHMLVVVPATIIDNIHLNLRRSTGLAMHYVLTFLEWEIMNSRSVKEVHSRDVHPDVGIVRINAHVDVKIVMGVVAVNLNLVGATQSHVKNCEVLKGPFENHECTLLVLSDWRITNLSLNQPVRWMIIQVVGVVGW
jgi:hypothetical protein